MLDTFTYTAGNEALTAAVELSIITLQVGGSYASLSGTKRVTVSVAAGYTPSKVTLTIGQTDFSMKKSGSTWFFDWDTTKKISDQTQLNPSNYLGWLKATAVFSTFTDVTPLTPVYVENYSYGTLAAGGYRPDVAFTADYSSKDAWAASYQVLYGSRYANIVPDPTGLKRNVLMTTLPDSARFDDDQPTNSPRFQSQQSTTPSTRGFYEGDEYYVGFSVFVPLKDSSAIGSYGFPHVAVSDPGETNWHIAIFQKYGPQATSPTDYPDGRGSAFIIDANRKSVSDPFDKFHIQGNQLNGGDPGLVAEWNYNRGRWTDIVLGVHESADIRRGWIELYINQGDGLKQIPLFGLMRLPRVTLWPMSSTPAVPATTMNNMAVVGGSKRHRTDLQMYRSPTAYPEATLGYYGHKVGSSVGVVDPHTYG